MPSPLLRALCERHGVISVDEASIDAFLATQPGEPAHRLLLFAGDPEQRSETHDVAIILPQLLRALGRRLRAARVAPSAETLLKDRFHVGVFPSIVVTRGDETLGVLPKVLDWADYVARIEAMLRPDAPALAPSNVPRVKFTFSHREDRP